MGCSEVEGAEVRGDGNQKGEKKTHILCFRNPLLTKVSVGTKAKPHTG